MILEERFFECGIHRWDESVIEGTRLRCTQSRACRKICRREREVWQRTRLQRACSAMHQCPTMTPGELIFSKRRGLIAFAVGDCFLYSWYNHPTWIIKETMLKAVAYLSYAWVVQLHRRERGTWRNPGREFNGAWFRISVWQREFKRLLAEREKLRFLFLHPYIDLNPRLSYS